MGESFRGGTHATLSAHAAQSAPAPADSPRDSGDARTSGGTERVGVPTDGLEHAPTTETGSADQRGADPVSIAAQQHPDAASSSAAVDASLPAAPIDFALFDTAIGACAIAWAANEAGTLEVVRFQLPESGSTATRARIARRRTGVAGTQLREATPPPPIIEAIAGIRAHLHGELDDLRWIPVSTEGIPEFHRMVYTVTRAIDPGHVMGYGQVATRIGMPGSAQAVGQALGRNPIPLIIPCHRVIAADNALTGFSAPGGVHTKQRLLTIEQTPGFGEPTLF